MILASTIGDYNWVVWVIFAIMTLLSIVLLSGRGAFLIAGYNTASKKEKSKFDEKKLCRVTGIGMSVISIFLLVMAILNDNLPTYFTYIFFSAIVVDVIVMLILMNTICKK